MGRLDLPKTYLHDTRFAMLALYASRNVQACADAAIRRKHCALGRRLFDIRYAHTHMIGWRAVAQRSSARSRGRAAVVLIRYH